MAISFLEPDEASFAAAKRRLRFRQGLKILEPEVQQSWLERNRQLVPPIEAEINVPMLAVASPARESFVLPVGGDLILIDDTLRRDTFQVIEEFSYTLDRPLIPWTYFALVIGEMIPTSGAPHAEELTGELAALSRSIAGRQLTSEGYIERLSLVARSIKLDGQTRTAEERLLEEAADGYVLYHEVAHVLFSRPESPAAAVLGRLSKSLAKDAPHTLLRDMWAMFWDSPSMFAADPRFGPLRVEGDEIDELDLSLRSDAIEELACDWFATCLLLLSDRFAELDPRQIIEVVLRHLSVQQFLSEIKNEVHQTATGRKRFRTLVSDATSVRQQRLLPALRDVSLGRPVFSRSERRSIKQRLSGADLDDLADACDTAVMRRQYVRSLCLSYPSPEDLECFPNLATHQTLFHEGHSGPDMTLIVQPAEWGVGDHERFLEDLQRFAGAGRLNEPAVDWDGAERLMPFLAEGYHVLLCLRRRWFGRAHEAGVDPDTSVSELKSSLHDLALTQDSARLSMYRWLYHDADTPFLNVYAVCLSCHAGFLADLADLSPHITPDTPMSEPWPIACRNCGVSPMGHSLMRLGRALRNGSD